MSLGHSIRWIYGLIMGTTTPWLKAKRPSLPERTIPLAPGATLLIGGTANGAQIGRLSFNRPSHSTTQDLTQTSTDPISVTQTASTQTASDQSMTLYEQVAMTPWLDSLIPLAAQSERSVRTYSAAAKQPEWRWLWEKLGLRELVQTERSIRLSSDHTGAGPIELIPFFQAHTGADLVAVVESHNLILCGALFAAGIHPLIDPRGPRSVLGWLDALDVIREKAQHLIKNSGQPVTLVGEIGEPVTFISGRDPIQEFQHYLRDLSNPSVPFNEMRAKYDWPELIGQTSLEENFDLLKKKRT